MSFVRLACVSYAHIKERLLSGFDDKFNKQLSAKSDRLLGSVHPHLQSGKLRAIAVGSEQASPLIPGLPTIAATGVPGYDASSITGMFVPANTPAAVIARLNQEIARSMNAPAMKQRFLDSGLEVATGTPEEFLGRIKIEITKWGKVIREAGIREE